MTVNVDIDMTITEPSETDMVVTQSADTVDFELGAEAILVKNHAVLENRDLADQHPISAITGLADELSTIPTKTSQLTNDSGFITDAGVTSFNGSTGAVTYTAPVSSVNSKTGAVVLSASDVGALSNTTAYALGQTQGGNAKRSNAILFGEVDDTSTSTEFTATIDGVTEYYDGLAIMLRNGVVTSASGFTIDINGLGAKHSYTNLADATAETTIFNKAYTMLFIYDSTRVSGGGWICYRGYDSNTNTIGYQLRTNSGNLPMSDATARYRLYFTSADGTKWVPANTSTSTNATTARTLNTRPINPFAPIVYDSTNGAVTSGARPPVATLWQQYTLTIGYSYVLSMTAWKPVYCQCTPQTDGSAVMETFTQTLPTTADGKIYIFLGIAYSTTAMELRVEHPVYYYDGTGLRIWTGQPL